MDALINSFLFGEVQENIQEHIQDHIDQITAVNYIVFSKDRPFQLYNHLQSALINLNVNKHKM